MAFIKQFNPPDGKWGYNMEYWFIHQKEENEATNTTLVKFGCYKNKITRNKDKNEDGTRTKVNMLPYAHINVEMSLPGTDLTKAQIYTLAKAAEGSWFADAVDD